MKFDFSELNELELENIGSWPMFVKILFAVLLSALVLTFSYFFFISDALNRLASEESKELQLRQDYQSKYRLAANLPAYEEQLQQMEKQFADLLKMLPSKNEMPGLLDDLTFVATNSGLKITSLNWQSEIERDFYIEFPINLSVSGDYHQMGKMVSNVAKLPRIVSLHDFSLNREASGTLRMNIQAKTYRFKDQQNSKGK